MKNVMHPLGLCVALFIASCADGGEQAQTPPTSASFQQSVVTTFCEVLISCEQGSDLAFGAYFTSAAECAEALADSFQTSTEEIAPFLADGTVTFHADRAATCLSAINANVCVNGPQFEFLCADVYTGNIAAGAECLDDVQCLQGTYCLRVDDACPGTCTAQKATGDNCDNDFECLDGTGSVGSCSAGQCATVAPSSAPAAVGASCGLLGSGPDYQAQACQDGLYCKRPDDGESGTCTAVVAPGAPCGEEDVCGSGGICLPSASGAPTCTVPVVETTVGAACGLTPGGVTVCSPVAGLDCSEDNVCEKVTDDGTEGSMCRTTFFDNPCDAGLFCDADVCTPQKGDGEECFFDGQCRAGVCDTESFTCRAPNACGD